jgi:putative sterol carrier protein
MSVADDVKKILANMPGAFVSEKAANLDKTILVDLSGEGGGQWTLKIADGKVSVLDGQGDLPDLTLKMAASDFVGLTQGKADPVNLFLAGKIKVEGDIALAMKFQDMFDRG